MSSESQTVDYTAVLADLKARRERIDQAIQAIELMVGTAATGTSVSSTASASTSVEGPGAFLGMTIVDAAKKLLAAKRQPLRNPDIAAAFKLGGLHLNSADPVNTVGSVLTRRFNDAGDIVRVGRGTWGLAEWYPNRSFKKKAGTKEEPDTEIDKDIKDLVG